MNCKVAGGAALMYRIRHEDLERDGRHRIVIGLITQAIEPNRPPLGDRRLTTANNYRAGRQAERT